MVFKSENCSKTKFHRNGLLAMLSSNFRKDKIRNNIIKQKMNMTRSLLADIKTKQLHDMDMSKEWKRGECQKKL
jgi:hypothetical protein